MSSVRRGRFISLEGGEGVGKSTQSRALAGALRSRGLEVVETREPGGSAGAEAIRSLLLEGGADRWGPRAEALLFAAARADHVDKTILPALEAGKWVICDRFLDSSIAYQGGADGLGADAIRALHEVGSAGLLPDRTLLLEMDMSQAAVREFTRDGGELDRFGKRSGAYHDRVVKAFHDLAQSDTGRFRIVSAEGSPEQVTGRLTKAIEDLL
jgi:dTMP kinase